MNGELITEYEYDSLNQLTQVADKSTDRYDNYRYDNAGNITRKQEHSLEHNGWCPDTLLDTIYYEYSDSDWGDLLTEYDGQTITYDNIGNPLSYRDGMTMSWTGRELQSISKNNNTYSFTYNLNGLRTKKNSNGTNTFYYYDDSNNLIGLKKGSTTVLFYYDSDGGLVSMSVGDDSYLFVKNLQGDIVKIIDEDSNVLATYSYDAWGKVYTETEDSSIAGLNPFRYRGYVYDPETELYYLQSRYYDPLTGRFINADAPEYTDTYSGSPLSTNMFAYCENNAIVSTDKKGYKKSNHEYHVFSNEQRKVAIKYAKRYYETPNTKDYYYFSDGDCANFISQCLFSSGGFDMDNDWYFYKGSGFLGRDEFSNSWTTVRPQYTYFTKAKFCKKVISISRDTSTKKIKLYIQKYKIRKGDLIYMDWDGNGYMDHSTMISSISKDNDIRFTAHTNPHFDKSISWVFDLREKNNKKKYEYPNLKMYIVVLR